MKKRVAIVTLGCPKNEVDSWVMRSHLASKGYEIVGPEEADVVVVNTCGFIGEAKEESIDVILEFVYQGKDVYVAGCLYQRYGDELVESLPEVKGWISLGEIRNVADILSTGGRGPLKKPVLPVADDFSFIAPVSFVYVKIAEGCSNRCNYCAIPLIKGPYMSRSVDRVVEEVRMWLDKGAKEVVLVSQDSAFYGVDLGVEGGLVDLLERINGLWGDFWVRVLYMHPAHVDRKIVEAVASLEKIVNYIEVPFQHVSERVLGVMGRKGGKEAVLKVAEWAEEFGLKLRTTFLVGHPFEEDRDFLELVEFVEELRPWRFSVFGYSPEEGTVSYGMPAVDEEVVKERVSVLTELQDRIIFENNTEFLKKRVKVLVDGVNCGRFYAQAPDIDGAVFFEDNELEPGSWVEAVLEDVAGVDFVGRVLNASCSS